MEQLKIALVQAELYWEAPRANRENFEKVFKTVEKDTHLVVLPEMFTTGFTMAPERVAEASDGPTAKWMVAMASTYGFALTGSVVVKEDEVFRNRMYFVKPDGEVTFYDKRHGFTLAGEDEKYLSGNSRVTAEYLGWKFFLQVCYDLRFPVFSRNDLDYDALIYVANWPRPRIDAWDTLLKARAIENMSYAIGVNRVGVDAGGYQYPGHSAVFDFMGSQLTTAIEEQVVYTVLDRNALTEAREKFRFLDDRDVFTLK